MCVIGIVIFISEFLKMLSEEGLATVTDIKDTNEDITDNKGYSTTTTTTTVLTKTWLLGFPRLL